MKKRQIGKKIFIVVLCSTIVLMFVYLTSRFYLMVSASYRWYDKVLGVVFFIAEFFIVVQGIGYISEIIKVFLHFEEPEKSRPLIPELKTNPFVVVLIPSYHEPLDIVEETIIACYNLTYKNKCIFLLDDTIYENPKKELINYKAQVEQLCKKYNINLFRRKWRGAKAGIINDYLAFVQKMKDENFKFISYEKTDELQKKAITKPKYLIILDADQNPFPDFVEPLVAMSEKNEEIAFIQTPQYYTNFQENRIAEAAALQQIIFFEYICEGKGIQETIFCCGSNVIMRTDALISVGGFDETSVTEDSATSIYFHLKGWKTRYYNKVGVFGKGPEDLANYFKQQYRWAMGSIDLFKTVVKNFFKNPKKLRYYQWWEYLMSTSFYFSSLVYIILWGAPILYLLFNIPSFFASPVIYGIIFFPYFMFTLSIFYSSLKKRRYKMKDVIKGQMLLLVTFPVFIKAVIFGLLGKRKKFEVTAKKGHEEYPFKKLWPQIAFGIFCFVGIIWGFNRLFYERENKFAIAINMIWSFYNFLIMTSIFYYNAPEKFLKKKESKI